MHRRPLIAAVAAVALAVTACSTTPAANSGSGSTPAAGTPAKVTLQLQWVAQGQFAGYYAAADQGYYKDAGLDVTIKEGGVDIVPQTVLAQGQRSAMAVGAERLVYDRGNGWHAHLPGDVRAAVRDAGDPALPTNSTGLRCAAR